MNADDQSAIAPFWSECQGFNDENPDMDHDMRFFPSFFRQNIPWRNLLFVRPFMHYYKGADDEALKQHHTADNCVKLYDDIFNYTSQFIHTYSG